MLDFYISDTVQWKIKKEVSMLPAYMKIHDQIKKTSMRDIDWERLPSERVLAEEFEVSRTTQQAISLLVEEGGFKRR